MRSYGTIFIKIDRSLSLTEPVLTYNRNYRVADSFNDLQSRTLRKIHNEPLMHALSPWKKVVLIVFATIFRMLSAYCGVYVLQK